MNLLDFIFPRRCLGCGKLGRYFCSQCLLKIEAVSQICPVCAKNSPGGLSHLFCRRRTALDGLITCFAYKNPLKLALKQIKYRKITTIIPEIISLVIRITEAKKATDFLAFFKFVEAMKPIIIPVPLHWWRERRRWFNQAELFGQSLARHWQLDLNSQRLNRWKLTTPQSQLSKAARRKNLEDVFRLATNVKPAEIQNRSFILVDDIWTTGTTLQAAAKILKKAGAKTVWGFALAR